MATFKINLGSKFNNEVVYVESHTNCHRYGFTHNVSTLIPSPLGGVNITARACWCNRTWEVYPYQTALHNLCDRIAMVAFGCPSIKSFNSAKKWESARSYAREMMDDVDRTRGY